MKKNMRFEIAASARNILPREASSPETSEDAQ